MSQLGLFFAWGMPMKLGPIALIVAPLLGCQQPPSSKQTEEQLQVSHEIEKKRGDSSAEAASEPSATDAEWRVARLIDRLTDAEGIEATGKIAGTMVSVRCMSGNSLHYLFELPDTTDEAGLLGRSAAIKIRLDDQPPESTAISTDNRFPNQVRIAVKDVAADLRYVAEVRSMNLKVSDALAVRMALADRIRLAVRTDRGEAFVDFTQPDAVRQVLQRCSATDEEYNALLNEQLGERRGVAGESEPGSSPLDNSASRS